MTVVVQKAKTKAKAALGANWKGITTAAVVLSFAFGAYRYAPVVKIGAHSTTYTYSDIEEVYSFGNKIAAIRGAKPAPNRASAYQTMMLAGIEHEIGEARKFPQVNVERATNFIISQSPYAGVLLDEKNRIGLERFYKLFVMPALVDQDFGRYYIAKDPNRRIANEALKAAQGGGLPAAADKVGSVPRRIKIPIDNDTAQLAVEAKKAVGALLQRVVEDGTGYAIMVPVEVTDAQVVADIVAIPRQSINTFIAQELTDAKVPISDRFYSWFRVADLRKTGGFLAETAAAGKTDKAEKTEGEQ